jgi:hypothetical protein
LLLSDRRYVSFLPVVIALYLERHFTLNFRLHPERHFAVPLASLLKTFFSVLAVLGELLLVNFVKAVTQHHPRHHLFIWLQSFSAHLFDWHKYFQY